MPAAFDTPITTTDQSLERVLAAGLPVTLVFLGAERSLDETLSRLAREYAGQALIVKIHAAENAASTRRFQVRATPAVVTLRQGTTVSRAERISARDLEQHAAYLLGRGPRPAEPAPAETGAASARAAAGSSPQSGRAATGDGRPVEVTDATFEQQVLRSPVPVLIDFWAPWCGPCRMVAPTVEKLAHELDGRLRVVKINVDDNPGVSMRYGVQGIPTMMIFRGGQVADRWVGALAEPAIRSRVQQALGSGG
jgi:thioredoxin 1